MLLEDHTIALNDIIVACLEAADSYRENAASLTDTELARLFEDLATERASLADAIGEQVRALGALPREPDRELEQAQRLSRHLWAKLSANQSLAIIDEHLRAEAHITTLIETALAYELPDSTRQYLERVPTAIQAARARLEAIRSRLE